LTFTSRRFIVTYFSPVAGDRGMLLRFVSGSFITVLQIDRLHFSQNDVDWIDFTACIDATIQTAVLLRGVHEHSAWSE
jgi:hypothetical protein